MDLPNFELGPLEMQEVAASEPSVAPATVRIAVGREDFLLRVCAAETGPNRLFFRLDTIGAPVFIVPQRNAPTTRKIVDLLQQEDSSLPSLFEEVSFTLWQQELPELFRQILSEGNWQRNSILSAPAQTEPIQVCFNGAEGMWFSTPHNPWDHSSIFLSPLKKNLAFEELRVSSDAELASQILPWLEDPNSDCSFAYRWSQRTYEERIASVIEFKEGTLTEFTRVLQLLGWNEDEVWKESREWVSWGISFSKKLASNSHSHSHQAEKQYQLQIDDDVWDETLLSAHLKRGLEILHAYFAPCITPTAENTSIFRGPRRTASLAPLGYSFPLEPPTQHERLEARLQLRDWLRDKVAPEEIPFLLGEVE